MLVLVMKAYIREILRHLANANAIMNMFRSQYNRTKNGEQRECEIFIESEFSLPSVLFVSANAVSKTQ